MRPHTHHDEENRKWMTKHALNAKHNGKKQTWKITEEKNEFIINNSKQPTTANNK